MLLFSLGVIGANVTTHVITRKAFYSVASTQPYRFHIGASFAGKPVHRSERRLAEIKFPLGSDIATWKKQQLEVPGRALTTRDPGQDMFFVQEMSRRRGMAVGIADGVGGWADSGINPALFATALMYYGARASEHAIAGGAEADTEEHELSSSKELSPKDCLWSAFESVIRDDLVQGGSSTGLIMTLNAQSGLMKSANLGDSGFMLIRNGVASHIQRPQTHYFNCPKQLAKIPPSMRQQGMLEDTPDVADSWSTTLRHGDMLVLYTDGISDNVYPQEILAIAKLAFREEGTERQQAQIMADSTVNHAQQCMYNIDRVSPFEREAAQHRKRWPGGKEDDATVVVVIVSEEVDNPEGGVPLV
ncbi:hypothetical protein FRB94_004243 [Tulasnella sp. JGI-2019a]|nr:hypothetical protein FRB93_000243 [Tulasnella sp. JGI-2019a]KAG9015124.1 hypothetical protein FRB94_004243 [Tulasnella sp. JGI-2019a]